MLISKSTVNLPHHPSKPPSGRSHQLLLNTLPPNPSPPPLSPLINPKSTTRQTHQKHQVSQPQSLGLKHALQKRQVNHHQLSNKRGRDGEVEEAVREECFARVMRGREKSVRRASAGKRVEHVKQDECRECLQSTSDQTKRGLPWWYPAL
jgi:hypothetical protein